MPTVAATDEQLTLIIERLLACKALCEHCASACLDEEDIDSLRLCISLARDCASLCDLTAVLLVRHGHTGPVLVDAVMALCIDLCEQCAVECAAHGATHDHCAECAAACRSCIDACRAVLGVTL